MKITLQKIKIRDLVEQFSDNQENGVYGYKGLLNIRPAYQREFIYNYKQQESVIETILNGFPLNVMYWVENENGTYELLDGQQRTLSICAFYTGRICVDFKFFLNLTQQEKQDFLDYELQVYICKGTDKEKLAWFKTINIAGEKLNNQEIRNAVYSGSWITDARRLFSKSNGPAYDIGKDYLSGAPMRQDYLETVLKWVSQNNIEEYMGKHQHDLNAYDLWVYFENIINWIKTNFPNYNKDIMKGIEWGYLYNNFSDTPLDINDIQNQIETLLIDDDVTNKKGIIPYILTKDLKYLNIRAFTRAQIVHAYMKCSGICNNCLNTFELSEMQADHIKPWLLGGTTTEDNLQMLCKKCNASKSFKY